MHGEPYIASDAPLAIRIQCSRIAGGTPTRTSSGVKLLDLRQPSRSVAPDATARGRHLPLIVCPAALWTVSPVKACATTARTAIANPVILSIISESNAWVTEGNQGSSSGGGGAENPRDPWPTGPISAEFEGAIRGGGKSTDQEFQMLDINAKYALTFIQKTTF